MSDALTIRQQADAVELAAVNHRGHVRNLAELVDKGKRPKTELDMARHYLPGLQAAALTLRHIQNDPQLAAILAKAGLC